ncbi:MAG: hypothetical protein J6V44_13120 [Methanobrevibacter sp.]|nr:hypothetical protein [Methanobrevibacter sp.]
MIKKANRSMSTSRRIGLTEDVSFNGIPNVLKSLDTYITELEESGGIDEEFIYQWVEDLLDIRNELQANYAAIKQCARNIGLYDA